MDLHDLPTPLLQVRQLCKSYTAPRRHWLALPAQQRVLNNVDFELHAGRCLGLVGASGSGKSTMARLILALESPTSGQVLLDGQDLHRLPATALRPLRQHMAMVFQDPATALNPRRSVGWSIAEPLTAHGNLAPADIAQRVAQALEHVGLHPHDAQRYPHSFSGGQRQRIAMARAIITRPRLLVLDEPVSALDVSVQAQVLNVLLQLQHGHDALRHAVALPARRQYLHGKDHHPHGHIQKQQRPVALYIAAQQRGVTEGCLSRHNPHLPARK